MSHEDPFVLPQLIELIDTCNSEEEFQTLILNHTSINKFLSQEIPSCGLKDIFISVPIGNTVLSNSQAGQRTRKVSDIVKDILIFKKQIRDYENLLLQNSMYHEKLQEEMCFTQNQVDAERQIREQAESDFNLMKNELEKLFKTKTEQKNERNKVIESIQTTKQQLNNLKTSLSDTVNKEYQKVEILLEQIHKEQSTKEQEIIALREKNKSLIQHNAHERQRREKLHQEISELNEEISRIALLIEKKKEQRDTKSSTSIGFPLQSGHWRQVQKQKNDFQTVLDEEWEGEEDSIESIDE